MNHLTYWKLAQSPFTHGNTKPFFYTGGSVDEAMARIGFLIENQREIGLMVGPTGVGKSSLLRNLKWNLGKTHRGQSPELVYVSMTGLMHGELPRRIVASLRLGTGASDQFASRPLELVWRDIEDLSVGVSLQNQRLVFLLDDVDKAHSLVWEDMARLGQLPGGATLVLASQDQGLRNVDSSLLERCELRIDLPLWDLAQTADYFEWALLKANASDDLFDSQAIIRIQELSNGQPRRMAQLAELGLVAGAVRRSMSVTGPMVDQVASELAEPLGMAPSNHYV
ncbi:MAG: AAA family ATPase [Pirellulales bacterium]